MKHDYKDEEHIKSIAAIPQQIENGILIAEVPNEDKPKNPTDSYYQHYVCGLKIGDSKYTVHALIAVDAKGDRYYDHNLISIEKENLLNLLSQAEINNGFGTTPDTKSTTVTGHKFNKLISILQSITDVKARITPAQDAEYMSAVESGDMEKADRMVHDAAMAAGYNLEAYQGTDVDFNEFKRRRHANGNIWGSGFYFADSEDAAAGWGERAKIVNRSDDYKILHTYLSVHNPFEFYGDRLELGLGEYSEDVISKLDPEYDAESLLSEQQVDVFTRLAEILHGLRIHSQSLFMSVEKS